MVEWKKVALYAGAATAIGIPIAIIAWYLTRPECVTDTDCPEGYDCVAGKCKPTTVECYTNEQCPYGYECVKGKCVPIERVSVSGQVVDTKTLSPIAGAKVSIYGRETSSRYSAISDRTGHYTFENIAPDIYDMVTEKRGYCTYKAYYINLTYHGDWDIGYIYSALREIKTGSYNYVRTLLNTAEHGVNLAVLAYDLSGRRFRVKRVKGRVGLGGEGAAGEPWFKTIDGYTETGLWRGSCIGSHSSWYFDKYPNIIATDLVFGRTDGWACMHVFTAPVDDVILDIVELEEIPEEVCD